MSEMARVDSCGGREKGTVHRGLPSAKVVLCQLGFETESVAFFES